MQDTFRDPASSNEASYFRHPMEDIEPEITRDQEIALVAEGFARVLRWASRANSLVQMGQRMYVMLYILRPALIHGMTLEDIGRESRVTRQAIDKLVIDFRDTFQGSQNHVMKSEEARRKCKKAQLNRN